MKKITYTLAAIFASAFALTSCTKEMTDSSKDIESQGIPFEICASVSQTRTTTDNSWNTTWVAKDAINLFHAKAGTTTYESDGQFTVADTESGKFKGTLAGTLDADSYDWYAFYPYKSQISSPGQQTDGYTFIGHSGAATQNGNNDRQHLGTTLCPLYGISKGLKASAPVAIEMQQLTSVVEIVVKNTTTEPLTVTSIAFSTDEDIVGSYYINFAGENVVYTPKEGATKTVANLTVNSGTALNQNETASFFIPIKPHVANSGSTITLTVNGYEKTKKLTSDVTFAAGKIKTLNFDFDKKVDNYSGQYVAVVLKSGEYVYLTSAANGKRLATAKSGVSKITDYSTSVVDFPNVDSKYIWTIDRIDNTTYYTMCANALYIRKVATTDNYAYTDSDVKNAEPLDFVSGADGHTFTIKSTSSDYSGRILSVNTSNDYYAFYGNDRQLHEIVLIPYFTAEDTRTPLSTPEVIASLNSKIPNAIDVMWDDVTNAGSYMVTATPTTGTPVSNTVTADESTTYSYTITGLAYETDYTISVVAKPSDTSLYIDSEAGIAEGRITTEPQPSAGGGELKTWTYEVTATTDPKLNEDTPATVNNAKWSISMGNKVGNPTINGVPTKSYKSCGWKWGDTKDNYWESYTLSTEYFASKSVKSVTVNFLNNGKKSATMTVKQGENTIGTVTKEFGAEWTDLTAETTQGNGGTLTITYSVAQASLIHSITVKYYE